MHSVLGSTAIFLHLSRPRIGWGEGYGGYGGGLLLAASRGDGGVLLPLCCSTAGCLAVPCLHLCCLLHLALKLHLHFCGDFVAGAPFTMHNRPWGTLLERTHLALGTQRGGPAQHPRVPGRPLAGAVTGLGHTPPHTLATIPSLLAGSPSRCYPLKRAVHLARLPCRLPCSLPIRPSPLLLC